MGDHEQRLEEILAEWDMDKNGYELENMNSVSLPNAADTITISASLTSPYTYTSSVNLGAFPNAVYTTTGANTAPWATYNPTVTSGKINLSGEDADIEINGVSLWKTMQEIANRLNIMQTNPELEVEWKELRELGEQYRKLEQHILDKQATWDKLKAMPAPDIE
jgi:hypothetical protein